MTSRSKVVSVALLFFPSICLFAFRLSSPEFSKALSNDSLSEITLHVFAILIGLLAVYRYSIVRDHEYFRSKTISRLSKTYKQEEKGLWENSEIANQRLESKAYTKIRGRRGNSAKERLLGSIGDLNRESSEENIDLSEESPPDENVNATENNNEVGERISFFERARLSLDKAIEKSANMRIIKDKKIKSGEGSEGQNWSDAGVEDSIWAISDDSTISRSAIMCQECGTYNDTESNYCSSCGSYLS